MLALILQFMGIFILSIGMDWALLSRHIATYRSTNMTDRFPSAPKYFSQRIIFIVLSTILFVAFINRGGRVLDDKTSDFLVWPAILSFLVAHAIGVMRIRSSYK